MSRLGEKTVRESPAHIAGPRLLLLLSVFALLLIGLVMVYSASSIKAISEGEPAESYLLSQLMYAVVGIACVVLMWKFFPYHWWGGQLVWVVWGVAIVLLVATFFVGTEINGAKRWLGIGPVGIQPSEFVKVAFLLVAARIMHDLHEHNITIRMALVQAFLMLLVPLLFLYKSQSDLGTTLICFVGIFAVMWLGEVPLRVMAAIAGVGVVFAFAAVFLIGYRADRLVFLNPWNDGQGGYGDGYNLIRSFYAFSEGGLFGVGLGNSHEKYLYLFASESDFIFSIIGEELGMVGVLAVILLYLLFLYAGMRLARAAVDSLGVMIAGGCTIIIVFQAFLNIGCTIGAFPTTGKPLPFISSGGSSLIATFIMVGLILSVSKAADGPNVYEQRRADLRVVRAVQQPRDGRRLSAARASAPHQMSGSIPWPGARISGSAVLWEGGNNFVGSFDGRRHRRAY